MNPTPGSKQDVTTRTECVAVGHLQAHDDWTGVSVLCDTQMAGRPEEGAETDRRGEDM